MNKPKKQKRNKIAKKFKKPPGFSLRRAFVRARNNELRYRRKYGLFSSPTRRRKLKTVFNPEAKHKGWYPATRKRHEEVPEVDYRDILLTKMFTSGRPMKEIQVKLGYSKREIVRKVRDLRLKELRSYHRDQPHAQKDHDWI